MTDEYKVSYTSFNFYNHCEDRKVWNERDDYQHYKLFDDTMKFLGSIGFYVGKDKNIEKHYKCLSNDHRQGRYADLEFKAHRYPAGFEILFYQNVVFENKNGGEYDFDKLEKMPYLTKKQFELTVKKLSEFIDPFAKCNTKPIYTMAIDKIKYNFVESWHHPQKDMTFKLSDIDGTTCRESYNNTDRDNKTIHNGEIKYFRGYDGYLRKGKVYHNINNMWWVILNKTEYRNIADFKLFDLTEEDLKHRRIKEHKPPKEYIAKKESLQKATTKELLNELKRQKKVRLIKNEWYKIK